MSETIAFTRKIQPYQRITRVFVTAIFLISGTTKLIDIKEFANKISHFGMPNLMNNGLAWGISILEIILSILLIIGYKNKKTCYATIIFIGIVSIIAIVGKFIFGIENCGCFGSSELLRLDLMNTLIKNFLLITLIILMSFDIDINKEKLSQKLINAIIALLILGAFWYYENQQTHKSDVLENKSLSQYPHFSSENIKDSRNALIYIFDPICEHCKDLARKLIPFLDKNPQWKLNSITYKEDKQEEKIVIFREEVGFKYPINLIDIEKIKEITSRTPILLEVHNDTIKSIQTKTFDLTELKNQD